MRRGLAAQPQARGQRGRWAHLRSASLRFVRLFDPDKLSDFAGWLLRTLGPWLPENKIGRANLAAAFPEKSPAEIDAILRGVWDNLGRLGAEFAQLDRIWDWDPAFPERINRIVITREQIDRYMRLANDGKPALVFAAHLANWELPAICAATYKLDSAVLYRRPNIPAIDRWLAKTRAASMGEMINTSLDAPVKIAQRTRARRPCRHAGRSVLRARRRGDVLRPQDQRQPAAGAAGAPFRLPDLRHARGAAARAIACAPELTDEIKPARDAEGKIDIAGTMQTRHQRDRGLGARISRAVALAAPALALAPVFTRVQMPVDQPLRLR